jgi:predicted transcriptional regulator
MAKPKLDPTALSEFIEAGHSQAEAASHFGVSKAAISQRVKQQRLNTSKVIAFERSAEVADQQMTAVERLGHLQQVIQDRLTKALQQLDQPGANEAVLTDRVIKLAAEGRAQLRLQVELSHALIDLNAVREFKGEVFYAIRQEGTAIASRILDTLKARRALRPSVDLATLDTLGGFDGVRPLG